MSKSQVCRLGRAERSPTSFTHVRLPHQTQPVLSLPNQDGKSRLSHIGESWNISIPSRILPTRASPGCNVYNRRVDCFKRLGFSSEHKIIFRPYVTTVKKKAAPGACDLRYRILLASQLLNVGHQKHAQPTTVQSNPQSRFSFADNIRLIHADTRLSYQLINKFQHDFKCVSRDPEIYNIEGFQFDVVNSLQGLQPVP